MFFKLEDSSNAALKRQQIHSAFFNMVDLKINSPKKSNAYKILRAIPLHVASDVDWAKTALREIKAYRALGQLAYEKAIWIPCEK